VVLMGIAASFIARLLTKHRWIAWLGLVIILYVALKMFYEGANQVFDHSLPFIPFVGGGAPPVPGAH
jgi:predicted tellurium resistance membrane protein TerC